jgi:hypothetical protein
MEQRGSALPKRPIRRPAVIRLAAALQVVAVLSSTVIL